MNDTKVLNLVTPIESHKRDMIYKFLIEIGVNRSEFFEFLAYQFMMKFWHKMKMNNDLIDEFQQRWFQNGSPGVVHEHLENLINNEK
jgi:hypothetical protein